MNGGAGRERRREDSIGLALAATAKRGFDLVHPLDDPDFVAKFLAAFLPPETDNLLHSTDGDDGASVLMTTEASEPISVSLPPRSGLALFAAELWDADRKQFTEVTLAFDTMSDIDLVLTPFAEQVLPLEGGLQVKGVNRSSSTLSRCGVATIRLGSTATATKVQLSCIVADGTTGDALREFGIQILLSAWTGRQLGITLSDLSALRTPWKLLPKLSQAVSPSAVKRFIRSGGLVDKDFVSSQFPSSELGNELAVDGSDRNEVAPMRNNSKKKVRQTGASSSVAISDTNFATVCLSETVARTFMRRCNDNPFPNKQYSIDDIAIGVRADEAALAKWRGLRQQSGLPTIPGMRAGGKLSIKEAVQVYDLLVKHKEAFGTTVFPKQNEAPPVVVELLPGVKPSHTPPPLSTPKAQKLMLYRYYQLLKAHNAVEPADQSPWCYRLHLTTKGSVDEAGIPEKVRPTDDARRVNAKVAKVKVNVSDGMRELERASRECYAALSTDALSAFSGFSIHPDSRNLFTFYVPVGPEPNDRWVKVRRTRLPFGFTNSPFIMLDYFQKMVGSMKPTTRERLATFYDDFALLAPESVDNETSFSQLLQMMGDFFMACRRFGVQLSPPKTSVGLKEFEFYGFKVRGDGSSTLSEKQLQKIKDLQPPTTTAEVLSLQGLLTQFRKFCPSFSDLSAEISDLTKKGVRFEWGPAQDKAFRAIKKRLLDSCAAYAPNWAYPLTLACDASEKAVAGHLYQMIDGKMFNIGFYSRKLTATEKKLHIYFKETLAILYSVQQVKIIAASSPFKLRVLTDHQSLKYMLTSEKGALSAWHLAQLADVDYFIEYVKGENNTADFWSRYQVDDEQSLSSKGMLNALSLLLTNLGEQHRSDPLLWLAVPKKSELLCRRLVQTWRQPRGAKTLYHGGVNNDEHLRASWDFAILCPQPKFCLDVGALLLKLDRPFALLMPMDLLIHVPRDHDNGRLAAEVVQKLRKCAFLALPSANKIWVINGAVVKNAVCLVSPSTLMATTLLTTEAVQEMNLPTLQIHLRRRGMATVGDLNELRQRLLQVVSDEETTLGESGITEYPAEAVLRRLGDVAEWARLQDDGDAGDHGLRRVRDGILMYAPPGENPRLVVPTDKRHDVMELVHVELGHGVHTLLRELKRTFYWPKMSHDVKQFLAECQVCKRVKDRVIHQHALHRPRAYFTPRSHYSLDLKTVGLGPKAEQALVVVDRFSSYAIMSRLPSKKAVDVIDKLKRHVIFQFGAIEELATDSAPCFRAKEFHAWAKQQGIAIVPQLAFNHTAAASAERFWQFYEAQIRANAHLFPGNETLDAMITFAWNTQIKDSQFSPFEIQFGGPAVTTAVRFAMGERDAREPSEDERRALVMSIHKSAEAIRQITARRTNLRRLLSAVAANKVGIHLKPLDVGTRVLVFTERSGAAAKSRAGPPRNKYFHDTWTSPGKIIRRIGNTGYAVKPDHTNRILYRHRKHLRMLYPSRGSQ